jgi:hypothetical protein
MPRHDRLISASEIGAWCFCKKAWHLRQLGHASALMMEQAAGTRYHQAHFQNLRCARRKRAVARTIMLICLVLLIWIGIAGLWPSRW